MSTRQIIYNASPTAQRFHASNAFRRAIMGPVGSGKSVMCVQEILRRAFEQRPDREGRRRSRWLAVRNTYPELKATTIKTWSDWVPEDVCPITYSAPIVGRMEHRLRDGTMLDLEIIFQALDKVQDQKKLLSMELTGAWINEVREIPKPIIDALASRVGRFPSLRDGGSSFIGIIMDTNPPDDYSWYYDLAEKQKPEGWDFFRQPGGLMRVGDKYLPNPEAENIANLQGGYDYYLRQLSGAKSDYINVMLCGEYGSLFDGKPVYKEVWNEQVHVAREPLVYLPGVPLLLGWDFGRTPACTVGQAAPNGQLRILGEYYSDNSGIRNFAEVVVKPDLAVKYGKYQYVSTGDPAGAAKGQANEASCFSELEEAGFVTSPASTNDPTLRIESIIKPLSRMVCGQPGMIVDPRCQRLIRGFSGGYHYQVVGKLMGGGEVKYSEQPLKNMYSHIHDALQYLGLAYNPNQQQAREEVIREAVKIQHQNARRSKNFNPLDY